MMHISPIKPRLAAQESSFGQASRIGMAEQARREALRRLPPRAGIDHPRSQLEQPPSPLPADRHLRRIG